MGATVIKRSLRSKKIVAKIMEKFEKGQLRSGRGGRVVTNPKQAIAIGLSKARRERFGHPMLLFPHFRFF
ncbi:hypothetical protein HY440_00340 [Candidatus Microgenomates bacterium]|nr:hypothetical protein [Candidatus Microgenomates bacterium]